MVAEFRTRKGVLRDAGAPDVNVIGRLVDLPVGEDGPVGHQADQIVPGLHRGQAAPLAPSIGDKQRLVTSCKFIRL